MTLKYTTPVPNQLFDYHLKELKESELKIFLIVVRQTLGWFDSYTRKRKEYDWISNKQFEKKAGLSNKSVSNAIQSLISKKMICAWDEEGNFLSDVNKRRNAQRIYYSLGRGLTNSIPTIR